MGLFGAPDVAKLKAKGDVSGLIRLLADKDPSLRQQAVKALGDVGGSLAVGPILAALGDPVGAVQAEAATALAKTGDPRLVEPLIVALKGSDAQTDMVAKLRQLGDVPNATEAIAYLLSQEDRARQAAAAALGKIGGPQAVEPLISALAGDFAWTSVVAAAALGSIGDARAARPLGRALGTGQRELREQAAKALVKIGAPAVPVLVAALKNSNEEVRKAAVEALGQIGAWGSVEAITGALNDADSGVRELAARLLVRIGPVAAKPEAYRLLPYGGALVVEFSCRICNQQAKVKLNDLPGPFTCRNCKTRLVVPTVGCFYESCDGIYTKCGGEIRRLSDRQLAEEEAKAWRGQPDSDGRPTDSNLDSYRDVVGSVITYACSRCQETHTFATGVSRGYGLSPKMCTRVVCSKCGRVPEASQVPDVGYAGRHS